MDTSILKHFPSSVLPKACRLTLVSLAVTLAACSSSKPKSEIVVSVKEQKLGLYDSGVLKREFPISTSKFGIGDQPNSYRTPLGKHEIIAKIGHGLPTGAVLKSRHWNGEVLKPNAPGRDPIVSRILWLRGMEGSNRNAMNRYIYIHGTTEESRLGKPASYGCIRMGMKDVVDLFEGVGIGAKVVVTRDKLPPGIRPPKSEQADETLPETLVAGKMDDSTRASAPDASSSPPTQKTSTGTKKDTVAAKPEPVSETHKDIPVARGKSKKPTPKSEKITTGNRRVVLAHSLHG